MENDLVALHSSQGLELAAPHHRSGAHELVRTTQPSGNSTHELAQAAQVLAPAVPHGQSSAHKLALSTQPSRGSTHDLVPAAQPGWSSPQKKILLQDSQLWHRHLIQSIHTAMESLVDGYTYDDRTCETCVLAKNEVRIIWIPIQCTTTSLELVHSNTCGTSATKSIGGAIQFIILINDFSWYIYVYPLLNKLAGTGTRIFQLFQKKVENWRYTIKRFRCDNSRNKYNNKQFRSILMAGGMSFDPAPPYMQHKNGVAEWTIGVLMRKARSLLLDSQVPTEFWVEAICTAIYLHVRTLNYATDSKTPYTVVHKHIWLASSSDDVTDELSCNKLPLHHLRHFGCVAYKLIPKQQSVDVKMGAYYKTYMILGYVYNTTKIWKLWDPEQMNIT